MILFLLSIQCIALQHSRNISIGTTDSFLFSVIITTHNTEENLHLVLDSLFNQTIGISNIQVIIIHSRSTEKTKQIGSASREKFPNNFVFIETKDADKNNQMNVGLAAVKGQYVTFLDTDGFWDRDAFQHVKDFYQQYKEVSVVTCKIQYSGAATNFLSNDFIFKTTRVIDLLQEPYSIIVFLSSSFINYALMKDFLLQQQPRNNDFSFLLSLFLQTPKLGIVKEAVFRNLLKGVQTHHSCCATQYFDDVFDRSIKAYGSILLFVQHAIMNELRLLLVNHQSQELNSTVLKHCCNLIKHTMVKIDDTVILAQRQIPLELKLFCLSLKYGYDVRKEIKLVGNRVVFHNSTLMIIREKILTAHIHFLDFRGSTLLIEGRQPFYLPFESFQYKLQINNIIVNATYSSNTVFSSSTLFGSTKYGQSFLFECELSRNRVHTVKLVLEYSEGTRTAAFSYGKFSKIQNLPNSYYATKDFIISERNGFLIIKPYNTLQNLVYEFHYCVSLFKSSKHHIILYRLCYWLLYSDRNMRWLFSDRINKADDNGEHFFRYVVSQKISHIIPYFCILGNSSSFHKIKKSGRVLDFDSIRYKVMFLFADKIISSSADEFFINPFGRERQYFADIIHYDLVFLQHGVILHDLSSWLNRYNKNIKLFITSSQLEYLSLLKAHYNYSSDVVKLTCLPRFDTLLKLQQSIIPEKLIVITPTWRKYLIPPSGIGMEQRGHFTQFTKSSYCLFYNSLMNNSVLCNYMKGKGFRGQLILHPNMLQFSHYFPGNDLFTVPTFSPSYQHMFTTASILVTDYSSVAFDFAYLKKPVVYVHFDRETFLLYHTVKEGYFDFYRDGFGPVCKDVDSTVNVLIQIMQNACQLDHSLQS